MIFNEVRAIALSFPGVEEYLAFGRPTYRVRERLVACITKIDPDTLCLKVPDQLEREFLLATKPNIYYLTEQYANFGALLIRIPQASPAELHNLFEDAWRTLASKRLIAKYLA